MSDPVIPAAGSSPDEGPAPTLPARLVAAGPPSAEDAGPAPALRGLVVRNVGGVAAAQAVQRLTAFATRVLLLKYFLSDLDLGVIAIAEAFIGYFTALAAAGLEPAAIVLRRPTERLIATVFWLRALLCVALYGAVYLAAPCVAWLQRTPTPVEVDFALVVRLLALGFLLQLWAFPPRLLLLRELRNARAAWGLTIQDLVRQGASLAAAWLIMDGRLPGVPRYGALVAGALAGSLAATLTFQLLAPLRPRLLFDRGIARDVWVYGRHLLLAEFTTMVMYTFDDLAVFTLLGIGAAGLYSQSFYWGNKLILEFSFLLGGVLLPVFARLQGEPERLRARFLEGSRLHAAVIVPAALGLMLVAEDFAAVLGGTWTAMGFPLTCFALMGLLRALGGFHARYLMACGHPQIGPIFNACYLVLGVPALILAAQEWGVDGAAGAIAAVNVVLFPLVPVLTRRWEGLSLIRQLGTYVPALLATGVMIAVLIAVRAEWLAPPLPASRRLLASVGIGAVVYLVPAWWLLRRDLRVVTASLRRTPAPPEGGAPGAS